jgi:hypothetical protein
MRVENGDERLQLLWLDAALQFGTLVQTNQDKMKGVFTLSRLLCIAALAGAAQATFDCRPTIEQKDRKGETKLHFDLQPLSGLRTTSKTTETPPTTNEAKVSITLCGDDVLTIDDKVAEEDQVSTGQELLSARLPFPQSARLIPKSALLCSTTSHRRPNPPGSRP